MRKMTDPISKWTLRECINALKRMDADLLEYGYAIYIADRIHDLTRWIPVSERMPTEDEFGNEIFRVWVSGIETNACFVSGKIMVWVDSPFEADYEEYDPKRHKTAFTHWQRITPPETP
jgi:hypothetical protein